MPTDPERRARLILFIGLPIAICIWLVLMYLAGGYYHETPKFKQMLFWTAIIMMFQFIIADPIKFVVQALIMTFLYKDPVHNTFRYGIPRATTERDDIRFLKMRVEWNKSRLRYNWRHRDEKLNQFYRSTAQDMLLYGRYYALLIVLIIILNEPLLYYQADGLQRSLTEGRLNYQELTDLSTVDDVYQYIDNVLIDTFLEGTNTQYDEKEYHHWMQYEMGKQLGVSRLVQIRYAENLYGWSVRNFTDAKFMPGWKLPYIELPYKEKYWRIYDPWVPQETTSVHMEMYLQRDGYLDTYSIDKAYVAYLARNKQNSRTILSFLKKNNWLDGKTAALFMDFTVYIVDSNIFALTEIIVEFTPFGYVVLQSRVDTHVLLLNWDYVANWYWLILVVYILQLTQFCKILVLKLWYGRLASFFNIWNIFDVFIVFTNIVAFILYAFRERLVLNLVHDFELAPKLQYIDFRVAIYTTKMAEISLAILVCIATIRLWKILIFARVFRLFIRTLQLGAVDIFWALLNIMVFLIGLTLGSYMINGAARTISHTPISFVHILSFSLGYSERVNPMEKESQGHNAMGLFIYALVMFSVTLVLLNMLVTLVCIHFEDAKAEDEKRGDPKLSFWEFLKVEYDYLWHYFVVLQKKFKRKFPKKLKTHFQRTLYEVENKLGVPMKRRVMHTIMENEERQANTLRRIRIISDILLTQTEILNRRIDALDLYFNDTIEIDEEEEKEKEKKEDQQKEEDEQDEGDENKKSEKRGDSK